MIQSRFVHIQKIWRSIAWGIFVGTLAAGGVAIAKTIFNGQNGTTLTASKTFDICLFGRGQDINRCLPASRVSRTKRHWVNNNGSQEEEHDNDGDISHLLVGHEGLSFLRLK